MPRTIKLGYEDAFYHVMNRGKARNTIFHDKHYYQSVITDLVEAHQRFGVEIHAYGLVGSHYHLLLQTP